ncbi:dicarboxylate/amino acid:cation symporter [Parvularcula lutaonensis]|uniref:Dicarboxylate/amino acid:cation symporter n=1 Tax=Parvularcula lutaonensis TaxID=491923 RepID=A0ABV7M9B7_9PROT|nr:dicarboxylate/amino acid:cation symporter [Parvularcula lutaonensis]
MLFWGVLLGAFVLLFVLGRMGLPLWARVFAGLVLGGVAGILFGETAGQAKPIGDGFIKLIRMLIIPLIVTTLTSGMIALGDPKRIGSLGLRTIALYLFTTSIAVFIGIGFAILFKPGFGVDYASVDSTSAITERLDQAAAAKRSAVEQILDVIPDNPLAAMVNGDILPVIFFSILLGVAILAAGEKGERFGQVMESAAESILKLTQGVMWLAPFGVFALMCWVLGTQGLAVLVNLGKLAIALYLACIVHIFVVYGGLVTLLARVNFFKFVRGMADAMSTAYSTASSSATLPVTIGNLTKNLGVSRAVAGSVAPLGATINMDGTSIYLGIVSLFAAQAVGIDLGAADYIAIAVTATAASIGAAGIPSASLFLALAVLSSFGVTSEQAVLIIALIFPFDRLLDMMRTLTNVTGDAAVATTVAKWEGELRQPVREPETA